MKRTVDMTSGSPTGHILKFALPLIITNIGQQLYMIVDAAIVGRGVGVDALAAVGATDWSYWLILWTVTGITQGDNVVDIILRDMYPPAHDHSSRADMYKDLVKITEAEKIILIGETGTLPHPENIVREQIGWASFMTWSHEFCMTDNYTTGEMLKEIYDSPYSVTKESLPVLY